MTALDVLPPGAGARGRADGFADSLVGPAASRRLLTDRIIQTFELWGYGFIATPLIEPLDTISAGVGEAQQSRLFRFMDADGAMLALVGERTVSVARVVATQLHDGPFPLRLCYAGPVLRNQALNTGRRRETPAGGMRADRRRGLAADAECIALAAAALERGGVQHVQVDVGHAAFIPALLEFAGLDGPRVTRCSRRSHGVTWSRSSRRSRAPTRQTPSAACCSRFRRCAAAGTSSTPLGVASAARRPRRALQELAQLWDLLDAHAITDRVHLDLGAVRDWDYYTGRPSRCSASTRGSRSAPADGTTRCWRASGPIFAATGFVLHIDRCHDSISRQGRARRDARVLRVSWDAGAEARRARRGAAAARARCDMRVRPRRGWRWRRARERRRACGGRRRVREMHGSADAAVDALTGHVVTGLRVALPGGTLLDGACELLDAAGVARLDPRASTAISASAMAASRLRQGAPDRRPGVRRDGRVRLRDRRQGRALGEHARCYELADLRLRRVPPGACGASRLRDRRVDTWPVVPARRDQVPGVGSAVLRRTIPQRVDHQAARLGRARPGDRARGLRARHHRDRRTMAANDLVEVAEAGSSTARSSPTTLRSRLATRSSARSRRHCGELRQHGAARAPHDHPRSRAWMPAGFRAVIREREREGFGAPGLDAATARGSATSSVAPSHRGRRCARSSPTFARVAMWRSANGRAASTASTCATRVSRVRALAAAWDDLDHPVRNALTAAAQRLREFHALQLDITDRGAGGAWLHPVPLSRAAAMCRAAAPPIRARCSCR